MLNARDYRGMTPLLLAACQGHLTCISTLISQGAIIAIPDADDGSTALHWAAAGDEPAILKLLLDEDPSQIAAKNTLGRTTADFAASNGKRECLEMLIRYNVDTAATDTLGCIPLHYAAMNNMIDCLDLLLRLNPELIDTPDHEGNTALHLAAKMGKTASIELLLMKGANKDAKNSEQLTPFQLAFLYGKQGCFNAFMSHNKDLIIAKLFEK